MSDFEKTRRQDFIGERAYQATLQHYLDEEKELDRQIEDIKTKPGGHASTYRYRAASRYESLKLKYTGGEHLPVLGQLLSSVVEAFEEYAEECQRKSDADYYPPLRLDDLIDTYVCYLNLISFAVLLHREDLIPRIFGIIKGGDFDASDAVIEELLKFYVPDRPLLDY